MRIFGIQRQNNLKQEKIVWQAKKAMILGIQRQNNLKQEKTECSRQRKLGYLVYKDRTI